MKTNKECLIEKVTSKDATRKVLSHAFLKGETLIATNGKAMVQLRVEREEHDTDGFVTEAALKAARKLAKRSDNARIGANGALALDDGQSFPRPNEEQVGKYPECSTVWNRAWGLESKFSIAFDATELAAIAAAMGTDGVRLEMTNNCEVIRIFPCSSKTQRYADESARGILMPIRTE